MLGKDAKRRNRQRDLRQFLQIFCPGLDKTRSKFFQQSLWGILLSGSLVVARWLKWVPDCCKRFFYRHKRLLNQFKSNDWDHQKVLTEHQQACARRIEPDTPLIIDLCDLARPRARKLKYLALVRDGSDDGKLVNGYWCIEVYAYWGKGRITPLVLHPYSIEDPSTSVNNCKTETRWSRLVSRERESDRQAAAGGDDGGLADPRSAAGYLAAVWANLVIQSDGRHLGSAYGAIAG